MRLDQRLLDPGGPPAWVSLVLIPPKVAPLLDDPAVWQAMRRVLAGPPFAAVSTLVRDAFHFAGAFTVEESDRPERLADDPFATYIPPRSCGSARPARAGPPTAHRPGDPAVQGKPWPAAGFDTA